MTDPRPVREVHLHGAHAETFVLAVDSAAEAVRALITLRPELREHIRDGNWCVVLGDPNTGYDLGADELGANAGAMAIHIIPEVQLAGGFFRSGVGKIVIGIVLIAAAVLLGPAGGIIGGVGAGLLGGTAATAVLGLGISMTLGGLAMMISPTPKGVKATDQADPEDRPSFFFNGPVNISEQGAPIPLVYGYFRVGSVVVNAGAWNEDIAAEEVAATALLAPTPSVEDFPSTLPTGADPESKLYPNRDSYELLQPMLAKGGKGGTPGGAYSPREEKNNLRSRTLIRVHEVLCEGGIKGPRTWPNWGRSVYFDDTPLQDSAGNFNFKLSFAWYRGGWPNETAIPGFPASENIVSVGADVKYAAPVVRRVTSLETTFIRVNLRTPVLMRQWTNGDLTGTYTEMAIDYQVEGQPWTQVIYNKLEGKTTTGYERTYTFWLPARDGRDIDVRVRRISIDPDMHNAGDETPPYKEYSQTIWSSFTEVVDGTMLHNTEASFAMTLDAEQFPSIPKRSYEFDWLIVAVPSNYDPVARTYAGDWNGTFKQEWTNNPAWILYDLLTHPVRGLGRDLAGNVVDKWSFYEAAVYNDQLVQDGLGGVEPRFTFNGILNSSEEALNVLQAVASSFRAIFFVAGGIVYLTQDRPPGGYHRIFMPANVVEGAFDYQSTELKSRNTVAHVQWIDPNQGWEPQVEPVFYPDMIGRYGYREIQIAAYGCTSRGQAIRAGRYFLFSAHHEQELVSFTTGLEYADLRPGDVIGIQDPGRAAIDWSGRVLAIAGNQVTVDRDISAGAGTVWFSVLNTETFQTTVFSRQLVAKAAIDVLVLDDASGITPDSVFAITTNIQLTMWRVVSVAEQEDFKFQITAGFHDPRKYAFVEEGILTAPWDYAAIPEGPLVPPTDLRAEDMYSLDPAGAPQAGIVWSWTPSADPRVLSYIGDAQGPDYRAPHHWASIPGTTISIPQAETGEWKFSLKGADILGRRTGTLSLVYNTLTSARVPLAPLNFTCQQVGTSTYGAFLQWSMPDDLSISYWWLKWTPETNPAFVKWDAATTVQFTIPRLTKSIVVATSTGTFLLKSVSVRGIECAQPATALINISDTRPVAASRIEQPTWTGTKTNCVVELGELVLHGPSALDVMAMRRERLRPALLRTWREEGRHEFWKERPHRRSSSGPDLYADPVAAMEYVSQPLTIASAADLMAQVTLMARGVVDADMMINWIPLAAAVPLSRVTSAQWELELDVAFLQADGVTWGPWQPASGGNAITKGAKWRLRGVVFDAACDLKVSRMEEKLLLQPYDQAGQAITSAAGNVTVIFPKGYFQTPFVSIQAVGAPANTTVTVVAINATQFTVNSYGVPGGAAVPNVTFIWEAAGYGRTS